MIVYSNGRFHSDTEPAVCLDNSGFLFGHGVFTTLRLYKGQAPFLKDHLHRLANHAQALTLPEPPPLQDLQAVIARLVQLNQLEESDARLRITLTTQEGELFLALVPGPLPPSLEQWQKDGIAVITLDAKYRRWHRPHLKTLQYLPSVEALNRAVQEAHCQEAIVLARENTVLEGAVSNVFVVSQGRLLTPRADGTILPGLVRQRILNLGPEAGLAAEEAILPLDGLVAADEVFITNSVREVVPVVSIDNKAIGPGAPGPVTRKFQCLYRQQI